MPLTPQQDALCHKLEQQLGPEDLDAASIIRQQASEIDDLWDRLNHAYMVMRENIGDHSHLRAEVDQLRRLAWIHRTPKEKCAPPGGARSPRLTNIT
jgi:hypothetical protein